MAGREDADSPHAICMMRAEEMSEFAGAARPPHVAADAPWGEHERFLEMTRLGWSILDQYGKAINLAGRADDADAASARALVASLLFSASDVARAPAHKHPQDNTGRGRLFANAYKLHVMAGVVSFAEVHKRKPKGEEVSCILVIRTAFSCC